MELYRNIIYLLFFCGLVCGCLEIENGIENKPYFDLEGFIEKKTKSLKLLSEQSNTAPIVKRTISVGGKKEDVTLAKDKDEAYPIWEKEFLLFKESDINKSVLLKAYQEIKTDSSTIYSAKEPALKVQKLEVKYENDEVVKISILLGEENYLYNSSKSIHLFLKDNIVDQYSINGYRKLVANEALDYQVTTQLIYP